MSEKTAVDVANARLKNMVRAYQALAWEYELLVGNYGDLNTRQVGLARKRILKAKTVLERLEAETTV